DVSALTFFFCFSSRRRHTRSKRDWSSDVCSSDLPAAGSGLRFGADVLKQYSPLAGKPMLYHSIARLLATPEVEIAFVVLAPADTEFRRHDWKAFGERLAPLYCGGASRRDSVLNGLVAAAS